MAVLSNRRAASSGVEEAHAKPHASRTSKVRCSFSMAQAASSGACVFVSDAFWKSLRGSSIFPHREVKDLILKVLNRYASPSTTTMSLGSSFASRKVLSADLPAAARASWIPFVTISAVRGDNGASAFYSHERSKLCLISSFIASIISFTTIFGLLFGAGLSCLVTTL